MYRPSPVPRLRVEKNGSNRCRSTSPVMRAPSLATLRKARAESRESRRRWIAPGRSLACRRALSSRLTSTRRRCSASNCTPIGSPGRSTRNTPCSPHATPLVRAHSPHTAPITALASITPGSCSGPGATSITSSTMRFRRSTFSLTMRIRRCCAGSVASSASSALACEMAASGLRISCAMAADTRPIAASFSWRERACMLRTSSRKSTQNSSLERGSGWRSCVKRMRARKVRARRGSKASTTSRPASGQVASRKARSTVSTSAVQAGTPRSWNGARRLSPSAASRRRAAGLAARTRPARSTTSTPSCISSMTRRFSRVCWRAISRLPRAESSSRASRSASSPASTVMTKKPPPARPVCVMSWVASAPPRIAIHVATSSANVMTALVARAIVRVVSTAAISTGSTSRATKFRLDPGASRCSETKQTMSMPMVASHCGLRSRASPGSAAERRGRGSSHRLKACAA